MRDFFVGVLAVALFIGVTMGRATERSKRAKRDYASAKATAETAKNNASSAGWKAMGTVLLGGLIMLALFFGAMNLPK